MKRLDKRRMLTSESQLISAAIALGAEAVGRWSAPERQLVKRNRLALDVATAEWFRSYIREGHDPLGDTFCRIRTAEARRSKGAVYTPAGIVQTMIDWARSRGFTPRRVVDPGVGSGRFLISAGEAFPEAELVGIDIDPLATVLARGNLAASGFSDRAIVLLDDYRTSKLGQIDGKTLFIGNPPYVRHHGLERRTKEWLTEEASKRGYSASQLAGLHVHFFVATLLHSKCGDVGCFITAAEWLDVNYGKLVRELFTRDLGGTSLTIVEPEAAPFGETASTAVISTFEVGSRPDKIFVQRVSDTACPLEGGLAVRRGVLEREPRWSKLTLIAPKPPAGYVELGELFRVHRGQVTGANHIWIADRERQDLPPSVLFRAVTRAKELFAAGLILRSSSGLRQVIDIPCDLSVLSHEERRAVELFLRRARAAGADQSYVAANRKAWWSVGLREAAPILATYMARRPPAFVRNRAGARHINVAHGLYPLQRFSEDYLIALVKFLSGSTSIAGGRTYSGGLTKFEPKEMERIPAPLPEVLLQQPA